MTTTPGQDTRADHERRRAVLRAPRLPLPNAHLYGGIVIASVWIRDEEPPLTAMLMLLMPHPPYYRVVDIEVSGSRWMRVRNSERSHRNIGPAVEDYRDNGGDW